MAIKDGILVAQVVIPEKKRVITVRAVDNKLNIATVRLETVDVNGSYTGEITDINNVSAANAQLSDSALITALINAGSISGTSTQVTVN